MALSTAVNGLRKWRRTAADYLCAQLVVYSALICYAVICSLCFALLHILHIQICGLPAEQPCNGQTAQTSPTSSFENLRVWGLGHL